jgi:hypothetical protein
MLLGNRNNIGFKIYITIFSLCLIYTGYSRKTNTIIYDFFLLNGILTLVSLMSKLNSCEKEEKNKLL